MKQKTLNSKAANEPKEIIFNDQKIQINDVFYSSWGYEQTNIDFYQVMDIKGSKTLVLRRICATSVSERMSGEKVPLVGDFYDEELITRRLLKGGSKATVRISDCEYAYFMKYSLVQGVKLYKGKEFTSYY
ncbi:hypothetical protein ABNR98_004465 [Salmonella enterica]